MMETALDAVDETEHKFSFAPKHPAGNPLPLEVSGVIELPSTEMVSRHILDPNSVQMAGPYSADVYSRASLLEL